MSYNAHAERVVSFKMGLIRTLLVGLAWLALIVQPALTVCACDASGTSATCCCQTNASKPKCCAPKHGCGSVSRAVTKACCSKGAESTLTETLGCQCDGCTCSISEREVLVSDLRGPSVRVDIDAAIALSTVEWIAISLPDVLLHYVPPHLLMDPLQRRALLCVWLN